MTVHDRDVLLQRVADAVLGDGSPSNPGLVFKVDKIDSRLDRWDGALTFIRVASSILGVSGIGLILAAIVAAASPS